MQMEGESQTKALGCEDPLGKALVTKMSLYEGVARREEEC